LYTLENDTHQIKVIEGNSLYDFLKESQTLIQEGYEFDFETNEGFPQRIGLIYVSRMLKPKPKTIDEVPVANATVVAAKKTRSKTE
jgi:hypothetical protein